MEENIKLLINQRESINQELKNIALQELGKVALLYCTIYGNEQGVLEAGEDLCTIIAPEIMGSSGWANLVSHLKKISG
ncbi:hypothetical protein ACFQNF_19735 [Iodobacter arcticus]|uniref:Uncharacterized protein n=1 Tax=Iodobacter arcticus TaxID=590593 RepID=A0ABW2R2U5_9NEIS